jgi:TRAP-type C4-dicarboxylate transport system permease small subunit
MATTMRTLERWFDGLIDACGALSAILIGLIAVAITADVITRGFSIANLPWVLEAVEYALLAATFLGAPWVLKKSAHVKVDLVVSSLSARQQARADLAVNVLGFLICAAIGYYGFRTALDVYLSDTLIFRTMTVKEWWLLSFLPFSCALMAIEFLRRTLRTLRPSTGLRRDTGSGF